MLFALLFSDSLSGRFLVLRRFLLARFSSLKLCRDYLPVERGLPFEETFRVKRIVEIEVRVIEVMTELVEHCPQE